MIAGFYVAVARTLPSLELAENISSAQTTRIYDDSATPVLLAELHGLENREILPADQIPQVMRDAVVAVEDERFYEHSGRGLRGHSQGGLGQTSARRDRPGRFDHHPATHQERLHHRRADA